MLIDPARIRRPMAQIGKAGRRIELKEPKENMCPS